MTIPFFFMIVACSYNPEQIYKELERKELESGIRHDSIFKGIYFGMSYGDYRSHCMNMHVQGEFKEGGLKSGAWVEYKLAEGMKYPAALNFNPEFQNGAVIQVHASVYYGSDIAFAPGEYSQIRLMSDVLALMEKWYGTGFLKIYSPDAADKEVYVKVDGNRRITVYPDVNAYMINIWFVDLTKKKK